MRATTGHSDDPVSIDAIDDIIQQIEATLGGEAPKAALLFCSVEYEHEVILQRIQKQWPGLPLVGATSDGEISSQLGFRDDSVLLTVFSGNDIKVHAGLGKDLSQDPDRAIASAVTQMGEIDPKLCLTTFAPSTDASVVIRGLSKSLPGKRCPILGGLSGDHREFGQMVEFFGGEVVTDSLPLLLLEGDFEVSWGIGSGWDPTGREMTVTSSTGNVVHAIDGKPAMDVYRETYDEVPHDFLLEFPLACLSGDGEWQLRAPLSHDAESGSLTFAGAVEEGSRVRFTEVFDDGLLRGSEDAMAQALDSFAGASPELALVFTCAARKWVLGSEAPKEIDLLRAVAEDRGWIDMEFAGLYCFGEIAPNELTSPNSFHNETCVSVVLGK